MPNSYAEPTNLARMAHRLELDISSRGLRSGQRYITVERAALMLGVSAATAHRAMDLLVRRHVLVRHQGRGTFIGDAVAGDHRPHRIRTVFVLLPDDQEAATSLQLQVIIDGLRRRMGAVNVQFSFVPGNGALDFVRDLIQDARRVGQLAGAVPISCPRAVYRYLIDEGVPAVVLGTLHTDLKSLASVDLDYREVGRLLARYLLKKGHTRLALITTGDGRPGDNAFLDGVSDVLSEARLPHNALAMRFFSRDFDDFRAQATELLQRQGHPTGVICGNERLATCLYSVARKLELEVPRDVQLVFHAQSKSVAKRLPFAHVLPEVPFDRIAETVAEMLRQIAEGKRIVHDRVVIAVQLIEPECQPVVDFDE